MNGVQVTLQANRTGRDIVTDRATRYSPFRLEGQSAQDRKIEKTGRYRILKKGEQESTPDREDRDIPDNTDRRTGRYTR